MGTTVGEEYNALTKTITPETGPLLHENWFSDQSVQGLVHCVTAVRGLTGRIIEVGSWEGRSTIALANSVYPSVVHAVDTWTGNINENAAIREADPNAGHSTVWEIEHHGRDVNARFNANIAAGTQGNVQTFAMDWRKYFAVRTDPIAFLFIDGDHTYKEVGDNIRAALPLLQPGGVICGDDLGVPGIHQAVSELLPGFGYNGVWFWQKAA